MDLKIAARTVAVIAIAASLTVAIRALRDDDRPDAKAPSIARPGGEPDPRRELTRCRDLGAAALEDASCRKAWAESRRRFLQIDKPAKPDSGPAMPKPERFGERPAPDTSKGQDRLLPGAASDAKEGQPR